MKLPEGHDPMAIIELLQKGLKPREAVSLIRLHSKNIDDLTKYERDRLKKLIGKIEANTEHS